jgi:hypothetical protein
MLMAVAAKRPQSMMSSMISLGTGSPLKARTARRVFNTSIASMAASPPNHLNNRELHEARLAENSNRLLKKGTCHAERSEASRLGSAQKPRARSFAQFILSAQS